MLSTDLSICLAHINHIRKIAGNDSVGLGGDYDGVDAYVQRLYLFHFDKYLLL